MRYNVNDCDFEVVTIKGVPALYCQCRVNPETVPDELNLYEVRGSDDGEETPCEIAERIWVNFIGTILLCGSVMFSGEETTLQITEDEWNYECFEISDLSLYTAAMKFGEEIKEFIRVNNESSCPHFYNAVKTMSDNWYNLMCESEFNCDAFDTASSNDETECEAVRLLTKGIKILEELNK